MAKTFRRTAKRHGNAPPPQPKPSRSKNAVAALAHSKLTPGDRLRVARMTAGFRYSADFARALQAHGITGISAAAYRGWETDHRPLPIEAARAMAPLLKRQWYRLKFGDHPSPAELELIRSIDGVGNALALGDGDHLVDVHGRAYQRAPLYDLGHGDAPHDWDLLRIDWLREQGREPNAVALWRACDDMMALTVGSGDVVLVDQSIKRVAVAGVYLLRIGDNHLLRRVSLHPAAPTATISGDNPACERFDGIELPALQVQGRAFWVNRALRG